tara:strand:+ start:90 stop:251 length:162 start_codon:yes stop_codon:yes gene_type:complete
MNIKFTKVIKQREAKAKEIYYISKHATDNKGKQIKFKNIKALRNHLEFFIIQG